MWRDEILVDLHRLLRIHVDHVHEPAWIVRPNRNHHEVERATPRADRTKLGVIRSVPREVDPGAARLEREPAPQRLVSIAEPASAEVPGGSRGHAKRLEVRRLPPVQLGDLADPPAANVSAD